MSFSFSIEESHFSWYCSSCYCHHLSSCFLHCSNFFSDLVDLLHSDVYLISQASFFLRIIPKSGNSFLSRRFLPATTHHTPKLSFVLGTLLFFEPVTKILLKQFKCENTSRTGEYAGRVRNMLYPRCSSVSPLAISCPLFNS